jgi:hypothetical protein
MQRKYQKDEKSWSYNLVKVCVPDLSKSSFWADPNTCISYENSMLLVMGSLSYESTGIIEIFEGLF